MIEAQKKDAEKTFVEFFAGIGLMRMGLERAGWKIRFANDIDPLKEKIYTQHFSDNPSHFQLGDIHDVNAKDLPQVDLATASFPCTDLSLAGRREGLEGNQSSAFWGFVQILAKMGDKRPAIVMLENVEGFLSSKKGKDFHDALTALNGLGYAVDALVINAANFVPQSRGRLFIIGVLSKNKTDVLNDSQLSFYSGQVRNEKLARFILSHPEINWKIRELPPLPNRSKNLSDIVDDTPELSKEWWSEERVTYLLNQTFDRHRAILEIAKNKQPYSYFTAFRRVRNGRSMAEIRSDGIAGCLRTPKGGSAKQILLRVGKGAIKIRHVSPRECARLMGADDYKITGSFNEALFGFGDAVCVPVVTWIAENYLNPLLREINKDTNQPTLEYGQKTGSPQLV